jgi:hypothetical protein
LIRLHRSIPSKRADHRRGCRWHSHCGNNSNAAPAASFNRENEIASFQASDMETLQSQVNKAAKKRLSLSGLEVLHGRLIKVLRDSLSYRDVMKSAGHSNGLRHRCAL